MAWWRSQRSTAAYLPQEDAYRCPAGSGCHKVTNSGSAAWPENLPLGVRISATDWVEGGWNIGDSATFAKELRRWVGLRQPTIDQGINGGYAWREIECSRCKTRRDVDLAALRHPPTTFVHDLASRLRCSKCAKAGRLPRFCN
jgi:hypothetical protein